MRHILMASALFLGLGLNCLAQQSTTDAPATKEDVQRYLDAINYHDTMKKMMEAMAKPMHQMVHEQYEKNKDKLPQDFEARTTKQMDELLMEMPFDEMMQAMVPAYQKHFTKGDMDALVAFYNGPTGQKLLREMPALVADSMETVMPIMRKHMEKVEKQVQEEVAEALKESQTKPGDNTAPVKN